MSITHILAIVAFVLAAIFAFFIDSVGGRDVIGTIAIGLALLALSGVYSPALRQR